MFNEYADRRPDPDAPIDPRTYGIQEFIDLAELRDEVRQVFKIEVPSLEDLLA